MSVTKTTKEKLFPIFFFYAVTVFSHTLKMTHTQQIASFWKCLSNLFYKAD